MSDTRWLARLLKWVFLVFTVLMLIGAVAIVAVLLIDPKLPVDGGVGNFKIDAMGLSGTATYRNGLLTASIEHGSIRAQIANAAGLFEVVKHVGLPVALLKVAFYALLFDLLRRLFANVVRGESFTRQSIRLVQVIGLSLLVYSLASAAAESWFYISLYNYLTQHATIWVSNAMVRLPHGVDFSSGDHSGSPFGSPVFFSGLLVLALSEVFRQGAVLKSENDLTV